MATMSESTNEPYVYESVADEARAYEQAKKAQAANENAGAKPKSEWELALEKALTDVKARLDATKMGQAEPLFGDAVELLAREFTGARWLVTGLVTRLGITVIGGEPKTAKTWIGTELAIGVATGTKVCGEFFAEHGRVAYFYCEDIDVQVRNRVRALLAGGDRLLEPGRLFLQPRGAFIDVTRDEDLAWIVASCRRLGLLDLLVLDPLRDIHSGEEDKSDSMRNVMRRLRVLAELLTCTVGVVHHAPKSTKENSKRRPGQNLRGSGAIHGSVDSGIYLEDSDSSDGTNNFANAVTSQIKGARSAGLFRLDLSVVDDEIGEATSATWRVTKKTKKKDKDERILVVAEALHEWLRDLAMGGQFFSLRDLREHSGRPRSVPAKKLYEAADVLVEDGRAELVDGVLKPVIHRRRGAES